MGARQGQRSWHVTGYDLLLVALLFGCTALYVSLQPRNLSPADESVYLYEAKRVLEGEVLYRDVFEITTPGWIYLMAALFRLFGVDLATARVAMAVMHGITAAVIYASCRRLGIRPGLSWPAALAYLIVSQPAWPIASQHWLGTLLTMLVLLSCAGLSRTRARWGLVPGIIVGLLIGVHQQRGLFVGAGIAVWLVTDHLLQRRYRTGQIAPGLAAQLVFLIAGGALVVVPLCMLMLASAGFEPVWQALVIHPLFNYRDFSHAEWGQIGGLLAEQGSYTFPRLLKYLPVILVLDLVRLGVLVARRRGEQEARRLALLLVFCLASMLSIAYFPDFIHIAFIAPAFFVTIAESLDWAVSTLVNDSPGLRAAGWLAGAALLLACGLRLQHELARSRAAFPHSRVTAFGRVDFARPFEAELYDKVDELMSEVPSRQLFCYPIISYLYLMVDADNPTRFQFLLPGYSSTAQLQEVVEVLQQRKLPYIVLFPGLLSPDEPVTAYLQREYEPLADAGDVGKIIFRRKAAPSGAR